MDWYFFDYDLHHKFFFGTLALDFQFTNDTIDTLSERVFGIPTTLKEISHDETENAQNGRFTIRLTDRSSGKIPLKNMIMLLTTAYRRTHIDINGWEISARKLLKEGYKQDKNYPLNIEVPEIMKIIEIERMDIFKRLLKCGAYTFNTNSNNQTMLAALYKQSKFDVIQYLVRTLPYFHVQKLMRLMRLAGSDKVDFDKASENIDLIDMFGQFE